MDTNIFRVLILEPLKILACLFVIRALTFKLCLKAAYLSLKVRYLTFHVGKLVLSKRKLLTEYRRRAVLGNQLLNAVENGHSVVMPNYLITRKEIPLNCYWRTNWELIPSFISILPELTAQGGFASIPLHRLRMEHTNCAPAFGVRQLAAAVERPAKAPASRTPRDIRNIQAALHEAKATAPLRACLTIQAREGERPREP